MQKPNIIMKSGAFAICQLRTEAEIPAALFHEPWYSITKTPAELSVILRDCDELSIMLRRDRGWRCLEIKGPVPLDSVGVLAQISGILADAGVAVAAVATFNTDYLLVRGAQLDIAVHALCAEGYTLMDEAGD